MDSLGLLAMGISATPKLAQEAMLLVDGPEINPHR
jgi:hypothetical protein